MKTIHLCFFVVLYIKVEGFGGKHEGGNIPD